MRVKKRCLYLGVLGLAVAALTRLIHIIYVVLLLGVSANLKTMISSQSLNRVMKIMEEIGFLLAVFLRAFPIMILMYTFIRYWDKRKALFEDPVSIVLLVGAIVYQSVDNVVPMNGKMAMGVIGMVLVFSVFQWVKSHTQ